MRSPSHDDRKQSEKDTATMPVEAPDPARGHLSRLVTWQSDKMHEQFEW